MDREIDALLGAMATRMRVAMRRRDLTPISLARKSGIAENTVRRVLRGENTSIATLYVLAQTVGLHLEAVVAQPQDRR